MCLASSIDDRSIGIASHTTLASPVTARQPNSADHETLRVMASDLRGKTLGALAYIRPPRTHAVDPTVTVRSVKKFQRTYPPVTAPPSSELSPSDSRTTPDP